MFVQLAQMARQSREQADEAEREKWIEVDGGVEYLCVNCDCCGKTWRRQKIVRIEKGDYATLKLLEQTSRTGFYVAMRKAFIACLTGAFFWFVFVAFNFTAILVALLLTMVSLSAVFLFVSRSAWQVMTSAQKEIFARYPALRDGPDFSLGVTSTPGRIIVLPRQ